MTLDIHPLYLVDEAASDLVALYFRCRGGAMGGDRLPFAGSVMEQPAWTLSALEWCGVIENRQKQMERDAEAARKAGAR